MQSRVTRGRYLSGLASTVLCAPSIIRCAAAEGLTKLVYQTAWTPTADDAGMYQAVATGIYKSYGLDVELVAGGPQLNSMQIFFAGKADFVTTDAFRVFEAVQQGLPGVAIAAFYQKSPVVLLSHQDAGNDTLADLKNKPILIAANDRQSHWLWLKAKYGYTDDQARPYTFSMVPFLVDKNLSMQGYITDEPYQLRRQGVQPVVHMLADNGYLDYNNVVLASPRMVAEKKPIVARFVDATIKGWQSYLNGDPKPANDAISRVNPDLPSGLLDYARSAMKHYGLFDSADVRKGGLGAMSDGAWSAMYQMMSRIGALPAGIDVRKGYTLEFVNKRVGSV
jgi:NitT/TauT family transport system substrate-binding protein